MPDNLVQCPGCGNTDTLPDRAEPGQRICPTCGVKFKYSSSTDSASGKQSVSQTNKQVVIIYPDREPGRDNSDNTRIKSDIALKVDEQVALFREKDHIVQQLADATEESQKAKFKSEKERLQQIGDRLFELLLEENPSFRVEFERRRSLAKKWKNIGWGVLTAVVSIVMLLLQTGTPTVGGLFWGFVAIAAGSYFASDYVATEYVKNYRKQVLRTRVEVV